mmetsp:Transcript_14006/g.28837  ORF Transcript_14006/g.28837 Transcript_14006/m.28837 type:complete len:107 (-) Transcript_14006:44-364(-)
MRYLVEHADYLYCNVGTTKQSKLKTTFPDGANNTIQYNTGDGDGDGDGTCDIIYPQAGKQNKRNPTTLDAIETKDPGTRTGFTESAQNRTTKPHKIHKRRRYRSKP